MYTGYKYSIPDQSEFGTWNQILARLGPDVIDSIDSNIGMFYPITFENTVKFIQNYTAGIEVFPLKLEIFPTHICNRSCRMCIVKHYQKNGTNENTVMPFELLRKILQDAEKKETQLITLSGGGEPSLHPEFDKILEYFTNSRMNLMLFTNGSNLSRENCSHLIAMDAIINISLNAGNRKEYQTITGVDAFEDIINVFKMLESVKKYNEQCHQLFNGIICASYVVIPENVSGIAEAVGLASEMGLDFINFKPASEIDLMFSDDDKAILADQLAEIQNKKWNTKVVFSKNMKIFYESVKRPLPVSKRCFQGLISLNIDANGTIFPCPVQTSKSTFVITKLSENSLEKFVTFEKYQLWPQLIDNKLPVHTGCFNDQSNVVLNWIYDLLIKYPNITFERYKK